MANIKKILLILYSQKPITINLRGFDFRAIWIIYTNTWLFIGSPELLGLMVIHILKILVHITSSVRSTKKLCIFMRDVQGRWGHATYLRTNILNDRNSCEWYVLRHLKLYIKSICLVAPKPKLTWEWGLGNLLAAGEVCIQDEFTKYWYFNIYFPVRIWIKLFF